MSHADLCLSKPLKLPSIAFIVALSLYIIPSFLTTNSNLGLIISPINSQLIKLSFGLDNLVLLLLLAVGILGSVVLAYAGRYLLSDATRTRFMVQLILTIGSVLFFIFATNLFSAFIGWQWIGLNLYLLLNHYHYQSAANRAAKKKFIINRLGDMCFLLAIVLCYQFYGTTEYEALAQISPVVLPLLGGFLNGHTLILLLVFMAIMTKSAQFPFHIWLPDTMQTPTPVSALMHAGVINAGGILLARLSPMFTQALWLPYVMLFVGITSLAVGGLLKWVQTDIKKKLAYSTMSQMGYMLMQSATGCFAAAIFHLIAHGFYKAALFLNAGNALFDKSGLSKNSQKMTLSIVIKSYSMAFLCLYGTQLLIPHAAIGFLMWAFIAISLEQLVRSALMQQGSVQLKMVMLVMFQLMVISYVWLLTLFESQVMLPNVALVNNKVQYLIAFLAITVHTILIFIPLDHFRHVRFVRKAYGNLLNKLFIEEIFRSYFLNPLREIGDQLNLLLQEKKLLRQLILFTTILLPVLIVTMKRFELTLAPNVINPLMSLAALIFLIVANRAKQLSSILQYLFASHLLLLSMSIVNDNSISSVNHLVVLIAYLGIFFSLQWLSTHAKKLPRLRQELVAANRLTTWGCYLAIMLFLTIGIPGTASFYVWFNLVAKLTINPIALLPLLMANVMLAIVVLHTLQDYVFNLQKTYELSADKKWQIHAVFIPIIIINLCGGLFPFIYKVFP